MNASAFDFAQTMASVPFNVDKPGPMQELCVSSFGLYRKKIHDMELMRPELRGPIAKKAYSAFVRALSWSQVVKTFIFLSEAGTLDDMAKLRISTLEPVTASKDEEDESTGHVLKFFEQLVLQVAKEAYASQV